MRRLLPLYLMLAGTIAGATAVHAQVVTRSRPSVFVPAAEAESPELAETVPTGRSGRVVKVLERANIGLPEEPQRADALTQLQLAATESGGTARVQSLQLFLSETNDRWQFFINDQFPLTKEATETSSDGQAPEISEYLRTALLDEYGGLLNTSIGVLGKLKVGSLADTDANHGLLYDLRGGVKLLEIPSEDGEQNGFLAEVSPFWTAVQTIKLSLPLWQEDLTVSGTRLRRKQAGGFVLAASLVETYAGEERYKTAFATPLDRGLVHLNLHLAISLPQLGYITISGTPVASDDGLKRRLTVSFNAMR